MTQYRLRLKGLTCGGCQMAVQKALEKSGVSVNAFASDYSEVVVSAPSQTPIQNIIQSVEETGFDCWLVQESTQSSQKNRLFEPTSPPPNPKRYFGFSLFTMAVGLPLMILGMIGIIPSPFTFIGRIIGLILVGLTALVVAFVAKDFFTNAFEEIKKKRPGMDTLFTLGITTAFLYSLCIVLFPEFFMAFGAHTQFATVFMVTSIVTFGRAIKEYLSYKTLKEAKNQIDRQALLEKWQPLTVDKQIAENVFKSVPFLDIQEGDIIRISHQEGEHKAVSAIDGFYQDPKPIWVVAPLSGESVARVIGKTPEGADRHIQAGTKFLLEKGDSIYIRATKSGKESSLYQLLQKTSAERSAEQPFPLAQKIGRWFAPLILGIAITTTLLWFFVGGAPLAFAIITFCNILLCACPCAFALASPASTLIASLRAMKEGIYIRDLPAFEKASEVNTVIFDKTGTLTDDVPTLRTDLILWDTIDPQILWPAIIALESKVYQHPIAKALLKYGRITMGVSLAAIPTVQDFKTHLYGIEGTLDGHLMHLEQFQENNDAYTQNHPLYRGYQKIKAQGITPICVRYDNRWVGVIPLQAQTKKEELSHVKETIQWLKANNIHIKMLTGDEPETALHVAKEIGLIHDFSEHDIEKAKTVDATDAQKIVLARRTPLQKAELVQALKKQGAVVAMIGDGVNDLHAIQTADVGVAVEEGVDATLQAPIILKSGDLTQFKKMMIISKALRKNVAQNLWFSLIYNAFTIVMAVGVLFVLFGFILNPIIASVLMGLSSIIVLINAARLKSILDKKIEPKPVKISTLKIVVYATLGLTMASLGAGFTCAWLCGHSLASLFSFSALSTLMPFCSIALMTGYVGVGCLLLGLLAYGIYKIWHHCKYSQKETLNDVSKKEGPEGKKSTSSESQSQSNPLWIATPAKEKESLIEADASPPQTRHASPLKP